MRYSTEAEAEWVPTDVLAAFRHPDILRLGCDTVAANAAQAFLKVCEELGPGPGSFACARELAVERLNPRERAFCATAGAGMSVAIRVLTQFQERRAQLQAIRWGLGQLLEVKRPAPLALAG